MSTLVQRTNIFSASVLGAVLLASCSTVQPERMALSEPLKIRGASGVVELAPVRLAAEDLYGKGTFVEHGGVYSLIDEDNPVDLATNAETQLLNYSLGHPELRVIMTIAEGNYRIIALRSAGIERISDLKGKRIGTLIASSSGYFLHLLLEREGLSFDDVELHNIRPFTAITTALIEGDVDAISIWEPHAENAIQALGDEVVVIPGNGIYREIFNLNSTADNLADPEKRAQIVEFVKVLIGSVDETNRDPRRAQRMVAGAGNYSFEEVARSWKHHTFLSAFPDDMLDVLVDEEIWLAELQDRKPRTREELAKLLDRSVFDEAMAADR